MAAPLVLRITAESSFVPHAGSENGAPSKYPLFFFGGVRPMRGSNPGALNIVAMGETHCRPKLFYRFTSSKNSGFIPQFVEITLLAGVRP